MSKRILVYGDWEGLNGATLLGYLHASAIRGKERFEFEFDKNALADPMIAQLSLDPRIGPYLGRQHPPKGHDTFGVFDDASPDRWGCLLMKRRHERDIREGRKPQGSVLHASDFLLGVHDHYRVGGIRLRLDEEGPFLDDQDNIAAPPFTQIRELEEASRRFEVGEDLGAGGKDWLRMLIAPGGSLGGARPKASVVNTDGSLWIAKFPSNDDEFNVGAWEMVVNTLASKVCGLDVAEGIANTYASDQHCFMVKRFDRLAGGRRKHFASAMTMTGNTDGYDHSAGASYLEIAQVLIQHGASTTEDLRELWRRIVFNMLVSNTDDHMRNHGFLLDHGKGWRLAPAYDMNPVPYSNGLKLNVSEADNAQDLNLALSVADRFRVKPGEAQTIIDQFRAGIGSTWHRLAGALRIGAKEIEAIAPAFELCK